MPTKGTEDERGESVESLNVAFSKDVLEVGPMCEIESHSLGPVLVPHDDAEDFVKPGSGVSE